jgi:hypothetical protein
MPGECKSFNLGENGTVIEDGSNEIVKGYLYNYTLHEFRP